MMYASGGNGSLFRIDPDTGSATYLFTPIEDRPSRLTSLVVAGDGCAYGVTGRAGAARCSASTSGATATICWAR